MVFIKIFGQKTINDKSCKIVKINTYGNKEKDETDK